MCSAIQPSSRAMFDAIRRPKHFFPSSALPPYPDPNDQISRVSGKWTMYFSGLQGHGHIGLARRERHADAVHARHDALDVLVDLLSAGSPMRAMVRMLTTT